MSNGWSNLKHLEERRDKLINDTYMADVNGWSYEWETKNNMLQCIYDRIAYLKTHPEDQEQL